MLLSLYIDQYGQEGVKLHAEYGYFKLTLLYDMEDMNYLFNCYFKVIKIRMGY